MNQSSEWKGTILKADTPTAGGNVYPIDVLKSIAEENSERVKNRRLIGEISPPMSRKAYIGNASHVVTSLFVEDDKLKCSIQPLPTPYGRILSDMINLGHLRPIVRGMGQAANGIVESFDLISIDFVPLDRLGTLDMIIRDIFDEE